MKPRDEPHRPRDDKDPQLDPELAEVARLLDEAASEEQRDLAAVEDVVDAPGLARFDETADALWREIDRRRRRARWTFGLGFLAVAAAIALVVVLARPGSDGHGPGGELLGEHDLRILRPVGTVRAWGAIEWSGPGGPYVLRVLDAGTRQPVLGPVRVVEPRYTPGAEETARWPAEIVIEVEHRRPDGTPERVSADAKLAP